MMVKPMNARLTRPSHISQAGAANSSAIPRCPSGATIDLNAVQRRPLITAARNDAAETKFTLPGEADKRTVTRVCLVGADDVDLRFELLSRETAREALETYDLSQPYENTLALDTVSVGAAVSLLNDLNWYLVRFADAAFVKDPSISEAEWLSRNLAEALRNDEVSPESTGAYLRLYGVDDGKLVEPLFVTRTDGEIPEYDLRDVSETVTVRVTESEFGG